MIKFEKMWKSIKVCKKHKRNVKEVELKDINLNEYIIIDTHLNSSINVPLPEIKTNVEKYIKNKNKKILICCQSGIRSLKAVGILESMGYVNVYNLKGGLENI